MPARRRLYLIDGYSNIFRAFYAIRNLSSSKGEPTNAVYGFVTMLRKLLRDEKPDLIGVAMDVSGTTTHRKDQYEEYKANRKPMPEDLVPQMPWIKKAIEAHRIPTIELAKYEADDVLGTLARQAVEAGFDVVLVSADKDLMQLVGKHVSLMHTGREVTYDPAGVEEVFGVPPEQVVDVLALTGDKVDNVPGVPGIGAKGAVQLVREFGSIESLLDRAEEVQRKSYRENLLEHREEAELSKKLVTIETDLDLSFDSESFEVEEPSAEALRELYSELEFTSLLEELGTEGQKELAPATDVATVDEWEQLVGRLPRRVVLGRVGPGAGPRGLAVWDGEAAWFADFRDETLRAAALASLEEWAATESKELVGHDLKEVLRPLGKRPNVAARLIDTMLLSYVARPSLRHGLAEVALERDQFKTVTPKEAGWTRGAAPERGQPGLLAYAAEQVELPARWVDGMLTELEGGGLRAVYGEIEEPLLTVLLAMEECGILIDRPFLAEMSEELGERIEELAGQVFDLAGDEFNLNSPQQLGEVLFERLGYPVVKKTRKTKSYSTDADTLQTLASQGFEVAEKVLEYRELTKLRSTYVDALPLLVAEDGRLHTLYQQAVAATGRLSSANPNLQNIPVRTDMGRAIRKAFVAPEDRLLLVADYNQVELRILAHIAQEPALIEAFRQGQDIHRATAAAVFGGSPELVTVEQRRAAKTINFGIMYGMSAFGLAQNLGIDRKQAQNFIDAYLDRYEGVKRYMEETLESALEEGKVETLYGRVRWLPDLRSRNWNLRENAKRMAINARIQGTAADLMKLAMIAVDGRLRKDRSAADILLTVHDELVLEVPGAEVEAVAKLVCDEMVSVADLDVPLVVDWGAGPNWYEAKD